jgi:hypothetical protein
VEPDDADAGERDGQALDGGDASDDAAASDAGEGGMDAGDALPDAAPACSCEPDQRCSPALECIPVCDDTGLDRGRILLIGDGDSAAPFACMLEADGFTVDREPTDNDFDGSRDLSIYDAAILLDGVRYGTDMPSAGQTALVDFVEGGGGLVFGEWVLWESGHGLFAGLAAAFPATYAGSYLVDTPTYRIASPMHPIAAGLPASFGTPRHWYAIVTPREGATVIATNVATQPMVVATTIESGRAVYFAVATEYDGFRWISSEELTVMFVQAARWAAGIDATRSDVTAALAGARCACP